MLRDAKAEPPLLVNMDAAGEFTSAEFLSELDRRKISYRLKKPGREQKNALAMVDTAIGKLSRILLRYRNDNDTEAWYPYLQQAVEEYNEKPLKHGAKLEGGTSTLRMAPEEIEEDSLDAGDEEGAGEAS